MSLAISKGLASKTFKDMLIAIILSHCDYHMVFTPKHRLFILEDMLKSLIEYDGYASNIIKTLCEELRI